MSKAILRKSLAFLTALVLCITVAGCGDGGGGTQGESASGSTQSESASGNTESENTPSETTAAEEEQPAEADTPRNVVTLQAFVMPSNTSGLMENTYWTDILERDLGVRFDLMPAGDQGEEKLAALMAANDLPDFVILKSYKNVVDAIAANLLVCLDDHQDKLKDAYANIPNGIKYFRDNVSNGTGKIYALPNDVSTIGLSSGDIDFGPYIRWDLYKELGMPVLETWEDLLPLMQAMVEIYPENEDGQKVYGTGYWTDWDSNYIANGIFFGNYYGYSQGEFGLLEVNYKDNSYRTILDEDSLYKRWLKFVFDMNQMGLLDPDTLTQRWGDYLDKQTAGRYVFGNWSWSQGDFGTPERTEQKIGFMPVLIKDVVVERNTGPNYIGAAWPMCIGANTKYLDQVLSYINYMYSFDGIMAMAYGDQGVYWDEDEGGPYVTEFGFRMNEDPALEFPNGSRAGWGISTMNNNGISTREMHPRYGVSIGTDSWQRKDFAPPRYNALRQDWNDTMNSQNGIIDWFKSAGRLVEKDFAPVSPLSDETDQINQRIGDTVKNMSWQMVYAKDEAEFNSLWADMVERANGMNLAASVEETAKLYQEALAFGSKYMN